MYNIIIISDDDSGLQNLLVILLLKISTGTQKFYPEIIDNLGTRPYKGSPALHWIIATEDLDLDTELVCS
jgi:hypothetical protein